MTDSVVQVGELQPTTAPDGALTLPNGHRLSAGEWATIQADELAADEHLKAIEPKNTTNAYKADWKQWERFRAWRAGQCQPVHLYAGTPGTLVAFVRWLDDIEHRAPSTIERRLAGVVATLRANGIEPGKAAAEKTRATINAIKKDRTKTARGRGRASALTAEHLTELVGACDLDTLPGLRNRAMLVVGLCYASRVAEASGLDAPDVDVEPDGLLVHVPPVKLRAGTSARTVWISASDDPHSPTCPRAAWLAWTHAAGITSGPAWRPINRWGTVSETRLATRDCERNLQKLVILAGITDAYLPWHALRAGLATQLIEAGELPSRVREITGHAEGSKVFDRYVRHAQRKHNNPIKSLNL